MWVSHAYNAGTGAIIVLCQVSLAERSSPWLAAAGGMLFGVSALFGVVSFLDRKKEPSS